MESLESRRLLAGMVRPDHVVVVIEQDRASDGLGNPNMPYLNQLGANGLLYTNTHSITHPTQPNMHALYAGSTQGITSNWTNDTYTTEPNLAKSLFDAGFSFSGYAETLPFDGSQATIVSDGTYPDAYARYTNPMAQYTSLGTLPDGQPRPNSAANRTFEAFSSLPTTDYSSLPTVSFVIPNNMHSTHGSNEMYPWAGSADEENNNLLRQWADEWLQDNLDGYLTWARTNNSLLIVTGDEERYTGGFAPNLVTIVDGDPRLFTPGTNGNYYNHYNLLRTLTDMYGLAPLGESAAATAYTTDEDGKLTTAQAPAPAATSTTLETSSTSITSGETLTLTATVSSASGTPAGFVTFKHDAEIIEILSLDGNGEAVLTTDSLTAGTHELSSFYSGNADYEGSASNVITVDVTAEAQSTTTSLIASQTSAVFGETLRFAATVTAESGTPTGNVVFKDGTKTIATLPLGASGRVVFGTSTLGSGVHSIRAFYEGATDFSESSSNPVDLAIAAPPPVSTTRISISTSGVYVITVEGGVSGSMAQSSFRRSNSPFCAAPLTTDDAEDLAASHCLTNIAS